MHHEEVIGDKVFKIALYIRRGLAVAFVITCSILVAEIYKNSVNEQL